MSQPRVCVKELHAVKVYAVPARESEHWLCIQYFLSCDTSRRSWDIIAAMCACVEIEGSLCPLVIESKQNGKAQINCIAFPTRCTTQNMLKLLY